MELDPAGTEVEAARRLLDRALVQVEPHERQKLGRRLGAMRQRPVVRRGEGRTPVGLVEAEHERPVDPVRPLDREQLVTLADHPVDVLAEVRVSVEHGRALGSSATARAAYRSRRPFARSIAFTG